MAVGNRVLVSVIAAVTLSMVTVICGSSSAVTELNKGRSAQLNNLMKKTKF